MIQYIRLSETNKGPPSWAARRRSAVNRLPCSRLKEQSDLLLHLVISLLMFFCSTTMDFLCSSAGSILEKPEICRQFFVIIYLFILFLSTNVGLFKFVSGQDFIHLGRALLRVVCPSSSRSFFFFKKKNYFI